jgi:integrase
MVKFQKLDRSDGSVEFVYQYTDPTNGQRVRFRGSLAQCQVLERKVATIRQELRHKMTTREAARATLPGSMDATHTRLRVIWDRYMLTLPKRSQGIARSTWTHHIDQPDAEGVTLGDRVPMDLSAETMARWVAALKESGGRDGNGRAPKTIQNAYDYLCACLRKILSIEHLPWGRWRPFRGAKAQIKVPREYVRSFEELLLILCEARKVDAKKWSRGLYADQSIAIVVGALAMRRNAELAGLGWDDCEIDRDPPAMTTRYQAPRGWRRDYPHAKRPTVPPKNGKVHRQILHHSVALALLEQRAQLKRLGWYRDDGPVFPDEAGAWRETGRVIDPRAIRRLVKAAGLPNVHRWSGHSLRHSGSSLEAVAQGGDLRATAAQTGHNDLRVLEGYVHQLGRGVARSKLPEVPRSLFSPAVDEPQPRALLASRPTAGFGGDPWELAPEPGDMRATFEVEVEAEAEAERRRSRSERAESERSFTELAREWIAAGERGTTANGKPIPRPKAVTLQSRRRGANSYQKAKYAGKKVPECRKQYARAVHAVLGKWESVLRAERQRAATE